MKKVSCLFSVIMGKIHHHYTIVLIFNLMFFRELKCKAWTINNSQPSPLFVFGPFRPKLYFEGVVTIALSDVNHFNHDRAINEEGKLVLKYQWETRDPKDAIYYLWNWTCRYWTTSLNPCLTIVLHLSQNSYELYSNRIKNGN